MKVIKSLNNLKEFGVICFAENRGNSKPPSHMVGPSKEINKSRAFESHPKLHLVGIQLSDTMCFIKLIKSFYFYFSIFGTVPIMMAKFYIYAEKKNWESILIFFENLSIYIVFGNRKKNVSYGCIFTSNKNAFYKAHFHFGKFFFLFLWLEIKNL